MTKDSKIKILIFGANGMIGHKLYEVLFKEKAYDVWGTVNDFSKYQDFFTNELRIKIINDIWSDKISTVERVINENLPGIIINCTGVVKQNKVADERNMMFQLNGLFPHQLAMLADRINAKVITMATDCVFDGKKDTPYLESDLPSSYDDYGMSKYLGELHGRKHLTIRTSLIGHELTSNLGLLEWFLSQEKDEITGYKKAIFSGLTTIEFANFLIKYVIGNEDLSGLYHLSVNPISKYDLLNIIAKHYGKKVKLIPNEEVSINRALDSTILRNKTGYPIPDWETLISNMYQDYLSSPLYLIKRQKYGKTK